MSEERSDDEQAADDDSTDEVFADQIADQIESFLLALRKLSHAESPGTAVPMLLLEVSQVLLAGASLGAMADVVPSERFEPDPGPDPDLDELRERLSRLLADVDFYTEVFDPYDESGDLLRGRLSDDLASISAALVHGLKHHRAGRIDEALWWWQFSYLSTWGVEASAVLRALQSIVGRARMDAGQGETIPGDSQAVPPDEVAAEDAAARLVHDATKP